MANASEAVNNKYGEGSLDGVPTLGEVYGEEYGECVNLQETCYK